MSIKRIWINSNEPAEEKERVRSALNANTADLGVHCGDFMLETQLGRLLRIERKEPADFVSSVFDGRIFTTCEQMGKLEGYKILMIDGPMRYDDMNMLLIRRGASVERPMTKAQVWGVYRKIQALGVAVEEASQTLEEWLKYVAEWADAFEVPPVNRNGKLAPDYWAEMDRDAFNFVANLPMVGAVRAKAYMEWAGCRSIAKHLELLSTPFSKRDKPQGWGEGVQNKVREYFGLNPRQTIRIAERSEWTEELGDDV